MRKNLIKIMSIANYNSMGRKKRSGLRPAVKKMVRNRLARLEKKENE